MSRHEEQVPWELTRRPSPVYTTKPKTLILYTKIVAQVKALAAERTALQTLGQLLHL
jgi:hypothetical protein